MSKEKQKMYMEVGMIHQTNLGTSSESISFPYWHATLMEVG